MRHGARRHSPRACSIGCSWRPVRIGPTQGQCQQQFVEGMKSPRIQTRQVLNPLQPCKACIGLTLQWQRRPGSTLWQYRVSRSTAPSRPSITVPSRRLIRRAPCGRTQSFRARAQDRTARSSRDCDERRRDCPWPAAAPASRRRRSRACRCEGSSPCGRYASRATTRG